MRKKTRATFGDFDDVYKLRGDLKQLAHARLREPHIYWRLVVIGLLPMLIKGVFLLLTVVAGMSKGFSIHHIEQWFDFTKQFSNGLWWSVLSEVTSNIFGQITIFVALLVIRKHNFPLEMGAAVREHLGWRYIVSYIAVALIIMVLTLLTTLLGILLLVLAAIVFTKIQVLGLIIGMVAVFVAVLIPLYLTLGWSQVPYLIKEAIAGNDPQKLFSVLGDSWRMMRGYKFELLVTYLSLFWWYVFVAVTIGVGWIFVKPYIHLVLAGFYENLRRFERQQAEVLSDTSSPAAAQ